MSVKNRDFVRIWGTFQTGLSSGDKIGTQLESIRYSKGDRVMRNHWISLITLLALVLAGCGSSQINGQNENPAPSLKRLFQPHRLILNLLQRNNPPFLHHPHQLRLMFSYQNAENATSAPREIIEKAKADLVKQFGVNADQIRVTEARAVTWPDASLGCPQPDMAYAQVITPGYWILLEADGKQYPYHTDQNEQIILCLGNSSDPESDHYL